MAWNPSTDPPSGADKESGGTNTGQGERTMAVVETLGIVVGLVVIALMALAPALMTLHDGHPSRRRRTPERPAPRADRDQPCGSR